MGDREHAAPSKKRFAVGQLSRDNPELEDDSPEPEMGTFKRASSEVLATRRIVKVRRQQPPATSATAPNPFAGLIFSTAADSATNTTNAETQLAPDAKTQSQPVTESQTQPPGSEEPKVEDSSKLETEKATAEQEGDNVSEGNEGDLGNGKSGDDQLEGRTSPGNGSDDKDKNEVIKTSGSEEANEVENGEKEAELKGEASIKETEAGTESKNNEEAAQEVKDDSGEQNVDNDVKGKNEATASLKSFQQLSSSQNAFSGLAGTGFSSTSFSFGSVAKEGFSFGTGSGSLFGFHNDNPSFSSPNPGNANHGASLKFFSAASSDAPKNGGGSVTPALPEVPVETGEENEKAVFSADAILFEYLDGSWKERGKGELKVNVSTSGGERARLVMRAKGNYRLILNASLYPEMSLTDMEKRGVTFACVNSSTEGKSAMSTFALKFKDASFVEEFRRVVTVHKGKKVSTSLKTPENSPKASDD